MHFGWAMMGNTMTGPVFTEKFGWDKEETKLYLSIMGNISLLGLMIGSIFGGGLITGGRRRAIFIVCPLIYIGAGMTMFLSIYTILVGRFL
jgi:hypothetical protein